LPPGQGGAEATTRVLHRVGAAGVYRVSIAVTTRGGAPGFVKLKVGQIVRRTHTSSRGHRATVNVTLAVGGRAFIVSATARRRRPHVQVWVHRVRSLRARTTKPLPAKAVPTRAKTVVKTPSGATGTTGAAGTTATLGSPSAPPLAPPSPLPPVLQPGVGPNGAPILALPPGFAPVVNYSSPAADFEFDGSSLPTDWSAGVWNYGYQATQYQPSQVTMTGSSAALTAIHQTSPEGFPYTSGWMSTAGGFSLTHGLIDFRAKMPAGQGLWSGLWLDQANGSNPWGEIDVQEMLLGDTHTIYGSLHGWAPAPLWGETQSTQMAADATQGFHDYQVVWQPEMLTWAVDGVVYAQYTKAQAVAAGYPWPFDNSTGLYLVADLGVGGAGEWGGAPNASTVFPATMQVQSVKVWE